MTPFNIATNTTLQDAEHPSALTLPVVITRMKNPIMLEMIRRIAVPAPRLRSKSRGTRAPINRLNSCMSLFVPCLMGLIACANGNAQGTTTPPAPSAQANSAPAAAPANDWLVPFPAHRVMGNVYYVGSAGLASYLITTPAGNILINSSQEANVPLIQASIEKLGFKFSDIKILLISHAHWDHCGGSAKVKQLTAAKYMVMDADVPVVESGGKKDFRYGDAPEGWYSPAKVDRVLHDGDQVQLGGVVLVAHKTPGHTKGCTTWTMKAHDSAGEKTYDVVIVGSPNVNPGYKLVNNQSYPEIAQDYEHAFAVWKALPCDVFLGAHGAYYDLAAKFARLKDGAPNPFIDPAGYQSYITDRETAFRDEWKRQQAAQ